MGEKWGHKMEEEQWIANRYRKSAAANLKADLRVFVYSWVWVLIRLLPPSELIQTDSQGKRERVGNGRERDWERETESMKPINESQRNTDRQHTPLESN